MLYLWLGSAAVQGLGQGLPGIDAHPDQEHAQPSLQEAVGNVDEDAEEQEDQDAEEEGALAGLPQDGGPLVHVIGAAQLARAQPGDDEEADEGAEEGEAEGEVSREHRVSSKSSERV